MVCECGGKQDVQAKCQRCQELQAQYDELNVIVGNLQQQLANSKDNVITLESYRAAAAWDKAAHAIIRLHPEDAVVFKTISKLRELQKQYLSGGE